MSEPLSEIQREQSTAQVQIRSPVDTNPLPLSNSVPAFPDAGTPSATHFPANPLPLVRTMWQARPCPLGDPCRQVPEYLCVGSPVVWGKLPALPQRPSSSHSHSVQTATATTTMVKSFHKARLRKHQMSLRKVPGFGWRVSGHMVSAICIRFQQLWEASRDPCWAGVALGTAPRHAGIVVLSAPGFVSS